MDLDGREADSVSREVIVLDLSPPVVTLIGPSAILHEAGDEYVDEGAVWTDNVEGDGEVSADTQVDWTKPGIYVLRYERSDGSGNRSETVTRTVIVRDTRLPVITILGDGNMVMEAGEEYLDLGASWFDLVDGNGTLTGVGEVLGLVPGEYEVRYEFTDSSGNEAQPKTRIVRVLDRSAPHLELNGLAESIHPVGESYVDPSANWFDLVDGNGTVFAEGTADWNILGERVLIYRKSDQSGNAAEQVSRKVLVADLESPRLELEGEEQVNWQVGQPYEDVGAVWTDNFEGTGRIILSDQVNWRQVGEYLLTYEKVDGSGNRSETKTRLVSVRDRTVPELFLQGPNPNDG